MMQRVDKTFVIRGRVQGVGFRWWALQTATALGVSGAVTNLSDGSVRVVARADEETMARFADKLREGPPMARVERVEEATGEFPAGLGSFTIGHL